MNQPDMPEHAARKNTAALLFNLSKTLPLRERLTEGAMMASQAVASACLAYVIGLALHTEQAFWAAITAIAVTQHNYSETRNLSRDQFLGAMAGGALGLAGAALGTGLAFYAATVAAVIVVCWCLNIGSAARLGAITATIVLLVPAHGPIWNVALLRVGEVTLGALCSLLVAWVAARAARALAKRR